MPLGHSSGDLAIDYCCAVIQLCLTLCDPTDCSTPSFPAFHYLPEFEQTHVHWVNDSTQPSHPLLSPCLPAFNLSQHQSLFQWVSFSHQVAKVLASMRKEGDKHCRLSFRDTDIYMYMTGRQEGRKEGSRESFVVVVSGSVESDSLRPHGLQHASFHCPSLYQKHWFFSNKRFFLKVYCLGKIEQVSLANNRPNKNKMVE